MRNAIKKIILSLLCTRQISHFIRSQDAYGIAFKNGITNKKIKEVIQQQKSYIIKQYNLNELNNIQPIGFFQKDLREKKYSAEELDRQPKTYSYKQIEALEIENSKLLSVATKVLIQDLLFNHNLDVNNTKENQAFIFNLKDHLSVKEYNEVRQSAFMQKMREKYCEEKRDEHGKYYELKEDVTFDNILKEMKGLALQNEEAEDIWDYIKSFFQSIGNALNLREGLTASQEREVRNVEIRANNAEVTSFQQFVTTYEQNVNSELTHNSNS